MTDSNNSGQNGKGDTARPVKKSVYDKNYDKIDWGRTKNKTKKKIKKS